MRHGARLSRAVVASIVLYLHDLDNTSSECLAYLVYYMHAVVIILAQISYVCNSAMRCRRGESAATASEVTFYSARYRVCRGAMVEKNHVRSHGNE